jgi:hypothetical protein
MNNKINDIIKETKFPLLMLINILNNNISDDNKIIVIKSFFIHHIMLCIEYNLLNMEDLVKMSPQIYNLIADIYNILSKQLSIIPHIKKFQKAYKNNIFWRLNIDKMIIYLKNIQNNFLSLFDGSKGAFYFHLRLKGLVDGNNYHIEEMTKRLKKSHDMFKTSFFNEYNIVLLSYYQFIDLTFENKVKYTEYIFNKINNIINNIINCLILYENYRNQLYNILYNKSNIDIDINDVSSDIECDDLPFIVSK